ncbi:Acetylcholine receptor subunit alpha-like 1 [Cyphomyrmex costatus]|uniref:Acetylcholine receptor subunit alpha-like 1 n=1 Tax=Cyphomyrmex costatus TaxID=456900 RepID=A0A151IPS8_9HYME|nr:Acetylcholine receptor subunit alpha-like 1 [Cyphomyrmex costatus]
MAAAISCLVAPFPGASANPEAKRLYDDLLSNYNRLIRPVGNNSDRLTVRMGLRLSQLIDVNLKNQIMTTNVWVEQEWHDYKLRWNPDEYGGVDTLHVPSEHIWLPDIVLYNNEITPIRFDLDIVHDIADIHRDNVMHNVRLAKPQITADGNYEVTIMTKAILNHTGKVIWKPPAIYKSFCEINVEYFPFDVQTCFMKFGSWTYDGYTVDLQHLLQTEDSNRIDVGIDLTDYYISVEWDILDVPAVRNEAFYICCEEPYPDIIFNITLRRKTLFYTVNLIVPCVGISFLSVLVFYLPSDSGEKVSLSISILLSLTVFFLLLAEIIPPTSITVPLLGRYLLFTMVMVTFSVIATIAVLNVNFRSPVTHRMARWARFVITVLPPFLMIKRPKKEGFDYEDEDEIIGPVDGDKVNDNVDAENANSHEDDIEAANGKPPEGILTDVFHVPETDKYDTYYDKRFGEEYEIPPHASPGFAHEDASPTFEKPSVHAIEKTVDDARFIAQHAKNKDKFESVEEDWKYVAMVLDRIFLWIFTMTCVVGTIIIIFQAPSFYDSTKPIDIKYSKIAKKKMMLMNMGPEED